MLQSEFFKRLGVSLIILDRLLLSSEISPSAVKSLPGFGPLPFKLETGYLGVDEKDDVQLFYYFVPSEGDPQDDPLVLWLTGGPGCSALSGLVYEIGLQHNLSRRACWHRFLLFNDCGRLPYWRQSPCLPESYFSGKVVA